MGDDTIDAWVLYVRADSVVFYERLTADRGRSEPSVYIAPVTSNRILRTSSRPVPFYPIASHNTRSHHIPSDSIPYHTTRYHPIHTIPSNHITPVPSHHITSHHNPLRRITPRCKPCKSPCTCSLGGPSAERSPTTCWLCCSSSRPRRDTTSRRHRYCVTSHGNPYHTW